MSSSASEIISKHDLYSQPQYTIGDGAVSDTEDDCDDADEKGGNDGDSETKHTDEAVDGAEANETAVAETRVVSEGDDECVAPSAVSVSEEESVAAAGADNEGGRESPAAVEEEEDAEARECKLREMKVNCFNMSCFCFVCAYAPSSSLP